MSRVSVGVVGYGRIGRSVTGALLNGDVAGASLVGVSSKEGGPGQRSAEIDGVPWFRTDDLIQRCDLLVEVASAGALEAIVEPALAAGKKVLTVSSAGLVRSGRLLELALDSARLEMHEAGSLHFVTCPLPGMDLVHVAARAGSIEELRVVSSFRPAGLLGEEFVTSRNYLASIGIDVNSTPTERMHFATCTARDGAIHFPEQFNTPVSFALAGPGLDETVVEVWADPEAESSYHQLYFRSNLIDFSAEVRIHPDYPSRKSLIVAPNVLAAIARHVEPVWYGS